VCRLFVCAGYFHCIPFLDVQAQNHAPHCSSLWLVVCPLMQIINLLRFLLPLSEIAICNFFPLYLENIAVTLRLSA
jgi:hypothetical protein